MRQLFEKYKDCIDIDRQSRQDGKWILYQKVVNQPNLKS